MNVETAAATPVVNVAALEPLFAPWEEPDKHRGCPKIGPILAETVDAEYSHPMIADS